MPARSQAISCLLAAAVITLAPTLLRAGDWPQFRGPGSHSVSSDAQPPDTWSETENLAWKVDLPGRGPSSPIVVGDSVVVTCSSGVNQDRLHVLCFDATSGEPKWERQFWATGRTLSHPTSANAAPTPASDGRLIFAFYSSNDMACLDLDGNLKWFRGLAYDFPRAGNDVGMASSPVVVGDTVVAQVECQGDSFATGIDKYTGESRWRIDRPRKASWSSPTVMRDADGNDVVLLQSTTHLTAHDPATGRELWSYEAPCDGISSAVASDDVVFVPSKGTTALHPSAGGKPEVLWNESRLHPGAASIVVADGRLIVINRAGVLSCASASDGKILSRQRLSGEFWGTPVLVGNRLYAINKDGAGQVVKISDDGRTAEIVGSGNLPGVIQSSPAVSAGALYVRSDGHLWKIAAR